MTTLKNTRLKRDEFEKIRREVLASWPTGAEVDFEETVAYQEAIKNDKRFSVKLDRADRDGRTLIQPRAGVALPDEHVDLLRFLEKEGEADLLPTTIDSYTRHNRYAEAQTGIEESRKLARSLLNGFPAVNHGVKTCRKVTSAVRTPVQIRHGTPDARLLTEISVSGGFTSYEGGGISYNIPYAKEHSLERTIADWQYCDRLIGLYEEAGVTINREPFGPLTGTLVPPCVSHAVAVLESLFAAAQGCRHLTVGYGQCGNLIQDVAAVKSLRLITEKYLRENGFDDVKVTTVLHQWMGGFPQDEAKAFGVISWGAAAAALSGATKVIVKTPHEALGIPSKEANAQGLKTTRQVVSMLGDQRLLEQAEVLAEVAVIEREVEAILKKTLELGEGDYAQGAVRAFAAGVIDVPFAPSKYNAGKILTARDLGGAVRFLEAGRLPFPDDLVDFHRQKLEERSKAERRPVSFQMVIDDIYAIGKGFLVGKPR
ncbi:MAG: methylaspartate mutase subunit E [Deltaproteobacteria bacterium]|jgi:methylaspartate mutase epsilon subunit|nr:methylaspartate mutase subunit E [Deltaproteobacteria bacterium]